MGRGNQKLQVKKDHFCPKCGTPWDTLSLMISCCEKEHKKNSGKKGGIAWNSGAAGSGSNSKQEEPDQKESEQQPKGQEKGKGTAKGSEQQPKRQEKGKGTAK